MILNLNPMSEWVTVIRKNSDILRDTKRFGSSWAIDPSRIDEVIELLDQRLAVVRSKKVATWNIIAFFARLILIIAALALALGVVVYLTTGGMYDIISGDLFFSTDEYSLSGDNLYSGFWWATIAVIAVASGGLLLLNSHIKGNARQEITALDESIKSCGRAFQSLSGYRVNPAALKDPNLTWEAANLSNDVRDAERKVEDNEIRIRRIESLDAMSAAAKDEHAALKKSLKVDRETLAAMKSKLANLLDGQS